MAAMLPQSEYLLKMLDLIMEPEISVIVDMHQKFPKFFDVL